MEQITSKAKIAILMATYNGGSYLGEQIESVLRQTCRDWHLYIHDDGSKDNTLSILQRYATDYPDRITLLNYPPIGNSCHNFLSMLEKVEASYYMFCDQDDVWHHDKIEKSMRQMPDSGKAGHKPVIVHTDLNVVDAQLRQIHPSFWKYTGLDPDLIHSFKDCIFNATTGCTMLFNAEARKAALQHPQQAATMHDAWVTCCCYAMRGEVIALHEATIDYRQHGDNCLGAQNANRLTLAYRVRNIFRIVAHNAATYRMLNSISPFSAATFIACKIRNKRKLRSKGK